MRENFKSERDGPSATVTGLFFSGTNFSGLNYSFTCDNAAVIRKSSLPPEIDSSCFGKLLPKIILEHVVLQNNSIKPQLGRVRASHSLTQPVQTLLSLNKTGGNQMRRYITFASFNISHKPSV